MLWPSTRATWKPNVTMSVAYTAADVSVLSHASSSSPTRESDDRDGCAATARPAAAGVASAVAAA